MYTKLIMTACSATLGMTGLVLTFAPDLALTQLAINTSKPATLLMQLLGALYFGFAMLNWMTRSNLLGGIYGRPVVVGNFTHFVIAGLALLKALLADPNLSKLLWIAGAAYGIFSVAFGLILFTHPIKKDAKDK